MVVADHADGEKRYHLHKSAGRYRLPHKQTFRREPQRKSGAYVGLATDVRTSIA